MRIVFVINNKKQLYGRGVYKGIYDCGGEQKSIRVVIDSHYAYADINDYDHKSVFSGNTWINPLTNSLCARCVFPVPAGPMKARLFDGYTISVAWLRILFIHLIHSI